MTVLRHQFSVAAVYALRAHRRQERKGTDVPYVAHLLAVASLVLESGGDEAAGIVALLHDVVEDQGGADRLDDVRARFGDEIADAVQECSAEEKSDTDEWLPRKQRYLDGLATVSPTALLVSLADKTHNLQSIVDDYRRLGDGLIERFNAPDIATLLWYYEELLEQYDGRRDELPVPLLSRLARLLSELRTLIRRPDCPACGAGDVVPVLVGEPDLEAMERAAAGEVVLAGCIVDESTPDWTCRLCGQAWTDGHAE